MLKWLIGFILILFVGNCYFIQACAKPTKLPDSVAIKQFEQMLEEYRQLLQIPGMSGAVLHDEQLIWTKGFGYADKENGIIAGPGTVYHLASLTKTFAAVIMLQLVEKGLLSLDDPITKFGVFIPGASPNVTVRHLLSHTSEGEPPGQLFYYNSGRYGKLDAIMQRVTGESFASLLAKNIIQKIELNYTYPNPADHTACEKAGVQPAEIRALMGAAYMPDANLKPYRVDHPAYFGVSAGMVSNVEDLARYALALDRYELLNPQSTQTLFTPAQTAYGNSLPYALGWFIYQHKGIKYVWHYGDWEGNSSILIKVPEKKLTFILLANEDCLSRPFKELGRCGDLMNSAFALAFIRTFVHKDYTKVNYDAWPEDVLSQFKQLKKDEEAFQARLALCYFNMYRTAGNRAKADFYRNLLGLLKQQSRYPEFYQVPDKRTPAKLTPQEMAAYAGKYAYTTRIGQTLNILIRNGALLVDLPEIGPAYYHPSTEKHVFFQPDDDALLIFTPDDNGQVSQMVVTFKCKTLTFKKLE